MDDLIFVCIRNSTLKDDPAAAEYDDPRGDSEDLIQLVGDEYDRPPGNGHTAHTVEEHFGLLRGENRCRLIEDKHLGVAIEHLEDLHLLALSHRQSADHRSGGDGQSVLIGQMLDRLCL